MKKLYIIILTLLSLLWLVGCGGKPPHHPKNPDFTIQKPDIKYKPSKKNLAKMVKQLQGSPYVWAEEGPNYFDCSGFTYYMYGSMGIEIPRTAREQAKAGKRIKVSELTYGDLIFFATNKHRRHSITHVGMYLGNGWFTHASTVKNEVIYSNLFQSRYYKNKLRTCRRYLPETIYKSPKPLVAETSSDTHTSKKSMKRAIVMPTPKYATLKHERKGSFYIQVGSFVGKPQSVIMARIYAQNLPYKIITFPYNGKDVSKLLIGPYTTRAKARKQLRKVHTTIEPKAIIAEIR